MQLPWHPMHPRDVKSCAKFLASFPEERRRYGEMLNQLPAAWLRLLRNGALSSAVHEEKVGGAPRIVGLGVTVFVTDNYLAHLKRAPLRWIGPELACHAISGSGGILSLKDIREANSRDGLNLVVWAGLERPLRPENQASLAMQMMCSFNDGHLGWRLRELIFQATAMHRVWYVINMGLSFWDAAANRYVQDEPLPAETLIEQPFLMGCTCESAMQRLGVWVSAVFSYTPPKIYFRPAEQRLLLAALRGLTDEDLADELTMSLSAVKKTWLLIYRRAVKVVPAENTSNAVSNSKRGKQKKQALLAYVREHPEELRPVLPREKMERLESLTL